MTSIHTRRHVPLGIANLVCILTLHSHSDIHKEYTGVTLVTQISLSRVNRLPYHIARWKDLKVIVVMVKRNELKEAWNRLSVFKDPSLRFILYIVDLRSTPYFIKSANPRRVQRRPRPFYSLNLYRDIGIESITTTHFLIIDGDVFVSSVLHIEWLIYS